mmetsp:Transcript_2976/g.9791  ORF Transcript_2976/g.9791 Transcript_2976/m.9791 type:complete len:235 (+) Transcript_2976:115-819(+)
MNEMPTSASSVTCSFFSLRSSAARRYEACSYLLSSPASHRSTNERTRPDACSIVTLNLSRSSRASALSTPTLSLSISTGLCSMGTSSIVASSIASANSRLPGRDGVAGSADSISCPKNAAVKRSKLLRAAKLSIESAQAGAPRLASCAALASPGMYPRAAFGVCRSCWKNMRSCRQASPCPKMFSAPRVAPPGSSAPGIRLRAEMEGHCVSTAPEGCRPSPRITCTYSSGSEQM